MWKISPNFLISQKNYYEFINLLLINLNNPDGKVKRGVENLLGARWEHELVFARAISIHHGGGMVGT